ncbi:hypothetical protein SprV_0301183400 [Sparganum proliferum]
MRIRLQPRRRPQRKRPQRLEALPAADENVSVGTRWCQLQNTVHSNSLAVLNRARRQHVNWFDDSDAVINNLCADKNRWHRAYLHRSTDAKLADFYQCRRLPRLLLRGMQDTCTADYIQAYADRKESKNVFTAIKATYDPQPKEMHRFSVSIDQRFSRGSRGFWSAGPSTSETSSTASPQSLTPPSTGSPKWKPAST